MPRKKTRQRVCQVCRRGTPEVIMLPASLVRPALAELIKKKYPRWSQDGYICANDLNAFRVEYVRSVLEAEKGELSTLDKEVLESLRTQDLISSHVEEEFQAQRTLGERLADRMADFGGSWPFIFIFALILCLWILVNSFLLLTKPFDPYPFILLNLVLSSLAAIQAPIIMMSQNRQESRDRLRATNDYQVNLKAELEIRHLHQKIDHLLSHQWERLVEIQEIQLDIMNELRKQNVALPDIDSTP